ncbi:MAG TPA: prolyl oligopeptidase family serine peptidase [Terracidiphilus sp.]|nr:prolyl oligopeptidase family serine peptidase [Terracidiphilus sp.]
MRSRSLWPLLALPFCLAPAAAATVYAQSAKPAITLDEYLNTTDITSARLSPDGASAVIATESPDWANNDFRDDLWLWNADTGLRPLTHSGSEEKPSWSPDGKSIAFISDRALPGEPAAAHDDPQSDSARAARLWVISLAGGEALPLYTQKLDVHAFAWSPDSKDLYLSVTQPLTPAQAAAEKAEWKDVIRWRAQYRGDTLLRIAVEPALERDITNPLPKTPAAHSTKTSSASPNTPASEAAQLDQLPADAHSLTTSPISITQIAPAPNGKTIAFLTGPPHHRVENPADYEIYFVSPTGGTARRITHNQGLESNLAWTRDSRWLCFQVPPGSGSIDGPYKDVQGRLYRMNPATGAVERLGADFSGSLDHFTLLPDGREIALGMLGVQTQPYLIHGVKATPLPGLAGTYSDIDSGIATGEVLLSYSNLNKPTQAYLAVNPLRPDHLKALTAFNPVFAQRAQPEWQTFSWKSDDGRTIQGVLIFPPGKKDARHLRMLTLIHGGPEDADGNRFGADWYDWATYAADNGWLVFRPNYTGSAGYGDQFMLDIQPHIVSKPGRDILTGIDALVKAGYADPDRLAIGGYSYGGYMTNWLITQTTRFKAAVTGAGAVEHAANWGNDDLTYDDAWYLGGRPWENPSIYQSEAALFQFNKVKTPVHLVQGGADVRVSFLEGVLMERALQSLNIPHQFLVFPGEGHGLGKNPWHGYIKVREELKWLNKYVPESAARNSPRALSAPLASHSLWNPARPLMHPFVSSE